MKQIQQMTLPELDKASEAIEDRRKDLATRSIYDVWRSDKRFLMLSEEKRIALASAVAQVIAVDPLHGETDRQILVATLTEVLGDAV